jgi:hypothetical protein
MAMVGDDLGDLIKQNVITEFSIAPTNQVDLDRWADAVGNAIVTYLKTNVEFDNALVATNTISGTTVSGSPEPVTGTIDDNTVTGGIK